MDRSGTPVPADAAQVADLLAAVYAANGRMAAEVDRIVGSRAAVSQAMIGWLIRLAEDLRPGARARAVLAEADPELLMAGASLWLARRAAVKEGAAGRRPPGRPDGRHEAGAGGPGRPAGRCGQRRRCGR